MPGVLFFGGEAEAAGWRLAGVEARVAAGDSTAAEFEAACADAELLLLDPATAARLPPSALDAARHRQRPLLCVLPAAGDRAMPDPVVAAARRQLGMEE